MKAQERQVTSRDVARLAGVSQATVSRAMADGRVSAETRTRVLKAMEELGYAPHASATAMKTRRTNTIGVVVADLANPFYQEALDVLTTLIASAGYRVVLWNTGYGPLGEALSAIRERAVDGVVFTTATEATAELRAAVERNSPIVLINRSVPGIECDYVVSENDAGAARVADFIVAAGRTKAAFIGGVPDASTSRERREGFVRRMTELGHPVHEGLQFDAHFSYEESRDVTARLLVAADGPDVIFCANDYMAFGALDAIRATRPTDAAAPWVIGFDDVNMAKWNTFDLTTVRQPLKQMAMVGVDMLLARIADPDAPAVHRVFPCELVVRGSTRATS